MLSDYQAARIWDKQDIAEAAHSINCLSDPSTILERLEERVLSKTDVPQLKREMLNAQFELFLASL